MLNNVFKNYSYFYLSELAANAKQDEQHKFRYVYKGSSNARGKKLYYVYGIGINSKDARSKVTSITNQRAKVMCGRAHSGIQLTSTMN